MQSLFSSGLYSEKEAPKTKKNVGIPEFDKSNP